ncbi:hypothetical protein LTS18_014453, partial [Coniosporium uncinatum]
MPPKGSRRTRVDSPPKDVPPADAPPDADADPADSRSAAQGPASKRLRTRSANKEKDGQAEKAKDSRKQNRATKTVGAKKPRAAKDPLQNNTSTNLSASIQNDPVQCPAFPREPPHHKKTLNDLTIPEMKAWGADNGIKPLKETSGKAKKEHWLAAAAQEYEMIRQNLIDHAQGAEIDLREDPSSLSPLEIRHRINGHYGFLLGGAKKGVEKEKAPAKKPPGDKEVTELAKSAAQKQAAETKKKASQREGAEDNNEPQVRRMSEAELNSWLKK